VELTAEEGIQQSVAVAVLPQLPAECIGWGASTPRLSIDLRGADERGLVAEMDQLEVREQMHVMIPIRSADGGGYEIVCKIVERLFSDGLRCHVALKVLRVDRRKPHRAEARAPKQEMAIVAVDASKALRHGEEFDVKLVDIAPGGLAFLVSKPFPEGDLLNVSTQVDGALLNARIRVAHCTPAAFGRWRVGCQFVHPSDHVRRRVRQIVAVAGRTDGHPTQRAA
jgi:hypothetical protein